MGRDSVCWEPRANRDGRDAIDRWVGGPKAPTGSFLG